MNDPVMERTLTEDEKQAFHYEGYVLLRGLLSPESVQAVGADVLQIMDQIGLGMTALRQTSEYLAETPVAALVNSTNLQKIAAVLLEGEARLYLPFTAVKSAGGGGAFHFHQDNQYTRFEGPGINLWIALSPMTEENGCLHMVPHSHWVGTLPSVKDTEGRVHESGITPMVTRSILMEPGDCVAFTRLTLHGSGKNTTEAPRVAYAVQYARNDVRYTRDFGQTWKQIAEEGPGWQTGPVEKLTIPEGKRDGH